MEKKKRKCNQGLSQSSSSASFLSFSYQTPCPLPSSLAFPFQGRYNTGYYSRTYPYRGREISVCGHIDKRLNTCLALSLSLGTDPRVATGSQMETPVPGCRWLDSAIRRACVYDVRTDASYRGWWVWELRRRGLPEASVCLEELSSCFPRSERRVGSSFSLSLSSEQGEKDAPQKEREREWTQKLHSPLS